MKVWCKKVSKITKKLDIEKTMIGFLVLATFLSGGILASVRVKAGTEVVDEVTVVIPVACSMSSTSSSNNVYTETVTADSYTPNIGDTRIKVFCNDFAGFSVYAVGFTNDTIGNNTMATSTTPAQTINTGTATSGNTSNWAMKLTKVTNTSGQQDITYGEDNLAITDGTTNYNGVYRTVPATYTKVATYTNNNGPATTDTALGSNIDARYAVFVSATQPAGTYEGKVKYMLVHPATMEAGTYTLAYNANGGTGTMTSETGLPNYQDHTIKANTFTAPTGYMFAGWCTVQDSNATAQNPQTTCTGDSYADGATLPASPSTAATAGGTLTLYAYWKVLPTINDLSYMQDFATLSSAEKTAVFGSMTTGIQYQLKDSRDQKDYYISKLADGNVWMTQNLDFDIVDGGANLNSTNTDVPANWEDGGNLTNTYTNATWNGSTTRPESYNPGDVCWLGEGEYGYDDTCADRHYHLGNYYNWTAAVAMSDSSDYTGEEDVNQSICPAGWRLPLGGSETGSKSFYNLVSQYGWDNGSYMMEGNYTMWDAPLYFPLGGAYWAGNIEYVGDYGFYWSSVVRDSRYAYSLNFGSGDDVYPDTNDDRGHGYSVRCVAR